MMTSLEQKVLQFVADKGLFAAPCRILLGLSGGADSMALLHVLHRMPGVTLEAVHIHHGLRGEEADRDADFVAGQCDSLGVPLTVHREDVRAFAEEHKIGLEEAGRRVRYAVFEELADRGGFDYITTAHNADDQAETVLMHLVRGCGVDGLVGIPAARGRIVRPLLTCTREEIEVYCAEMHVPFMVDSTNADTSYTRNACRHDLLPLMERMNPEIRTALFRLSRHAAEDSHFLFSLADKALSAAHLDDGGYALEAFLEKPQPVRRRMLVRLLQENGHHSFQESHITALDGAVLAGHGGVDIPGGCRLAVSQERIFVVTAESVATDCRQAVDCRPGQTITVSWCGKTYAVSVLNAEEYELAKNVHKMFFKYAIAYDTIHGSLYLRTRQEGDYLRPAGRGIGKSLKKLLIEWRVPSHLRDTLPLLCDDDGIVLLPGYTCDERVRPHEKTKLFLVWQEISEIG